MQGRIFAVSIIAAFTILTVSVDAQVYHRDDLDPSSGYVPGPWASQGGWTEWSGSMDVSGVIDPTIAFTGRHSGMIVGAVGGSTGLGDDMVWDYSNLPGGQPSGGGLYIMSVMTFVPSTATGTSWVIMVNRYPTMINWSLQVQLQANVGMVQSIEPAAPATLPLIFDEWISVTACIDLTNDEVRVFYGEDLLVTGPWIDDGDAAIAALDLYAGEPTTDGTSGNWFDNHRIEEVSSTGGPCAVVNVRPAQVTTGTVINIKTQSPTLASVPYGLFVWELNGAITAPLLVLVSNLDATGQSNIPGTVPPGLGGISVGFKSLIAAGPPLVRTNTFEVVFQ